MASWPACLPSNRKTRDARAVPEEVGLRRKGVHDLELLIVSLLSASVLHAITLAARSVGGSTCRGRGLDDGRRG